MAGDLIPQSLIPEYFAEKLSDGSLLLGFRNSRFHSHIYQKGNALVAHVTENAKGGRRIHTERIEVHFHPGTSLASMFKKTEINLPGDTDAIFLSFDSLSAAFYRAINGACPQDVYDSVESILASGIDLSSASAAASSVRIPAVIEMLHLLIEWERRDRGVLPRLTLDEARKTHPLNTPCFVKLEGKWVLVNLREKGVLMYPQDSISDGLSLILKLSRMEHLIAAPIKFNGREVLMNEELIRQLKEMREKELVSERKGS